MRLYYSRPLGWIIMILKNEVFKSEGFGSCKAEPGTSNSLFDHHHTDIMMKPFCSLFTTKQCKHLKMGEYK